MNELIANDDSCVVRHQAKGDAICQALHKEAGQLGYDASQLPEINWRELKFRIATDPADGSKCLSGEWFNTRGQRAGNLQFNGDGSFYAEYDILLPHPTDERWFVESVIAWGRENIIRTEPRLLAAV